MRYAERVTLLIKSDEEERYDFDLGKMVGGQLTEKVVSCHISEQGLELKTQLEEKLDLEAYILRFKIALPKVDKVKIGDKLFKVMLKRHNTLYVAEVANG